MTSITTAEDTLALSATHDQPKPLCAVDVQPSSILELSWVLFRIKRARQFDEPLSLGPTIIITAPLAKRVTEFWSDGARTFDELTVLAHWAGLLYDTDPHALFRQIPEVLYTSSLHALGMASERPDDRIVIEKRLQRLAHDAQLCSAYTKLLVEVWEAVAPEWHSIGFPAVTRTCTSWRQRLSEGVPITDLLPDDHAIVQLGLVSLLQAGIARCEIVVTPCHFLVWGHILDLSGVLSVGVSTTPSAHASEYLARGRTVAQFAHLLSNPVRAAVLACLIEAPASTADLVACLGISKGTARTHILKLKATGLISSTSARPPVQYQAVDEAVDRILNELSARLQRGHGRATRRYSAQLSDGAGFRAIFESAPIAIIQLDLRGRCLACNPETERMLGYSEAELSQLRDSHLLADEADSNVFELVDRVAGSQQRSDVRLRRKDGSRFWASVTVSPVSDDHGMARFIYVMLEDLSDRRGAEDFVTGLPNRVLFLAQLERLIALSRRSGERIALLMLDLDGFKRVNDTLGHDVGDTLLRQVGLRLLASLRESDTVARLGGDEFGVLITGASTVESATAVATKLRNALLQPFTIDGHVVTVGASFGIALSSGQNTSVSTLMGQTDEAMYAAKRARDGYRFAKTHSSVDRAS